MSWDMSELGNWVKTDNKSLHVSEAEDENSDYENQLKEFRNAPSSFADCLLRFIQCPLFIWLCFLAGLTLSAVANHLGVTNQLLV